MIRENGIRFFTHGRTIINPTDSGCNERYPELRSFTAGNNFEKDLLDKTYVKNSGQKRSYKEESFTPSKVRIYTPPTGDKPKLNFTETGHDVNIEKDFLS